MLGLFIRCRIINKKVVEVGEIDNEVRQSF